MRSTENPRPERAGDIEVIEIDVRRLEPRDVNLQVDLKRPQDLGSRSSHNIRSRQGHAAGPQVDPIPMELRPRLVDIRIVYRAVRHIYGEVFPWQRVHDVARLLLKD